MCFYSTRHEKEPIAEEVEKEEEDSGEEQGAPVPRHEFTSRKRGPVEEPELRKAQDRELRRVKKNDHSWLSSLLNS